MWIKRVAGMVVGVVVTFSAVMAGEYLLHLVFPMPNLDLTNPEAVKAAMAAAPLGAKLGLAIVYGTAAFLGTFIATWIAGWRWSGWVPMGLLLAATIANFMMLPHAIWLVVLSLVLIVLEGWTGVRLGMAQAIKRG